MPAFGVERLSDEQIRDILAYIGTPRQPEPTPIPEPRVRGVQFEILEATARPGEAPTVRFRVRDDAGVAIAPQEMGALALIIGGPTVDYRWALREDARGAEYLADSSARYGFRAVLPADAQGTVAAGIEGYLEHRPAAAGQPAIRDIGYNAVRYFTLTDVVPVPPAQSCRRPRATPATGL